MPIDKCDPCCDPDGKARSQGTYRAAVLQGLCAIYGALSTGPDAPWSNASATLAYTAATGSSTVAAGAYGVSIANVGNAAGTVAGIAFPAGAVVNFQSVEDPVSLTVKKLPAIAYNATGTTFNIGVIS